MRVAFDKRRETVVTIFMSLSTQYMINLSNPTGVLGMGEYLNMDV